MDNDYHKIVRSFKDIAIGVMHESVLSDIEIGEVTSVSPLAIQLEDKVTIYEDSIILTKNTCEWTMEMSVDHVTENRAGGGGYAEFASHNHDYTGRKLYLVHNQLVVGDKVILLRESGGQRYIALDRYYNPNRGCTTK